MAGRSRGVHFRAWNGGDAGPETLSAARGNGEILFCFPFSLSKSHINFSYSVITAAYCVRDLRRGRMAPLLPTDEAAVQLEGGGGATIDEAAGKAF